MRTPSPPPTGVRCPGSGVSPCRALEQKRSAPKDSEAHRPSAGLVRSRHAVGTHHLAPLRRRPLRSSAATACCCPAPGADGTAASTAAAARWRSAAVACFSSGARANRPRLDRAVLGATHRHRPRPRCALRASPVRVLAALLGRMRTLLTPTTVAEHAGLSLLVYCSSLLAPPWGLQEAPERAKERGIYAALALYLGTPAFAPAAPALRLPISPCKATLLFMGLRRHSSGLTRRFGGFGTASAWRTCCFWRFCSFSRLQEPAAS